MDLLLTETDGPSSRFDLNPESVIEVVETLAKLKKTSHKEIKETVFKNFDKLLRKDPKLQKYRDILSQS
jgi:Tat protein secretion system quality control protein TatD with DNase activity